MENLTKKNALFSQTLYKNALECASSSHKEQKTPHGYPYLHHVTLVAMEVMAMITAEHPSFDDANIALQCALLHDVLEDTKTSEQELRTHYRIEEKVIEGVKALTKDKTLPHKKAQMHDSLKRLLQQPPCVQWVKLADRITNLGIPPYFWNRAKIVQYQEEAKEILHVLHNASTYLAKRLQERIDSYDAYIQDAAPYLIFLSSHVIGDKKACLIWEKNNDTYLKNIKPFIKLNHYLFDQFNLEFFTSPYNTMEVESILKNYVKVSLEDEIAKYLSEPHFKEDEIVKSLLNEIC